MHIQLVKSASERRGNNSHGFQEGAAYKVFNLIVSVLYVPYEFDSEAPAPNRSSAVRWSGLLIDWCFESKTMRGSLTILNVSLLDLNHGHYSFQVKV